jgi:hypothetical protein
MLNSLASGLRLGGLCQFSMEATIMLCCLFFNLLAQLCELLDKLFYGCIILCNFRIYRAQLLFHMTVVEVCISEFILPNWIRLKE